MAIIHLSPKADAAHIARSIKAHRSLLELPSLSRATFLPSTQGRVALEVHSTHASTSLLKKSAATQSFLLSPTLDVEFRSPVSFSSEDIIYSLRSPDGKTTALFKKVSDGKTKRIIEFWDLALQIKTAPDADVSQLHGDWLVDDFFGAPSWSPDGKSIAYTAEDATPHADDKLSEDNYAYTPDFGELFTGKKTSNVYLLHVPTGAASKLTDLSTVAGAHFGQPVFLTASKIVATAYQLTGDGRVLGLAYCYNRPSALVEITLEGHILAKAQVVTPEGRSVRSPRVLDEKTYVFISNPSEGPHNASASLMIVRDGKTTELVSSVEQVSSPEEFPGLYTDQLPRSPFLSFRGAPHVVIDSVWGANNVPLLVSLTTGAITKLPLPSNTSLSVLATDGHSILAALESSPISPPRLVLKNVSDLKSTYTVATSPVSESLQSDLDSLKYEVITLPEYAPSHIILISPRNATRESPLLSFPHGGPHSSYMTEFYAQGATFALAGYQVALVNYPGSLGFGQKFIDDLTKDLGNIDVEATHYVQRYLKSLDRVSLKKGKRLLTGGSHGGYISTHLSGRYPDDYDATVLRNPVTDLTSMISYTDIPDWVLSEVHIPYRFSSPTTKITPEIFAELFKRSPMSQVEKVKLPTLLLIGQGDRRVPPDQARSWYHGVSNNKSKFGNVVEAKSFPGNGHALTSDVQTQMLAYEFTLKFLAKYTDF